MEVLSSNLNHGIWLNNFPILSVKLGLVDFDFFSLLLEGEIKDKFSFRHIHCTKESVSNMISNWGEEVNPHLQKVDINSTKLNQPTTRVTFSQDMSNGDHPRKIRELLMSEM